MAPKTRPDVTVQQVGEEALVLDLQSGQIHQLNATAAWILSQCDGETAIDTMTRDFAECFSVDTATAERDITTTIEQLQQVRIIEPD